MIELTSNAKNKVKELRMGGMKKMGGNTNSLTTLKANVFILRSKILSLKNIVYVNIHKIF